MTFYCSKSLKWEYRENIPITFIYRVNLLPNLVKTEYGEFHKFVLADLLIELIM